MELEIGGVNIKDVIKFQTRIMFGSQYSRIEYTKKTNNQDALLLACLRIGWNDAFRHVTINKETVENDIKKYRDCKDALEDEFCLKYGKISQKKGRKAYDDYYSSILNNEHILSVFKEYASSKTTDNKCTIIQDNLDSLNEIFAKVKEKVLFGHIQKLFNIAIKYYLCLYMCKDFLDINESLFCGEIVSAFEYADCPIDSIILERCEQQRMKEKGVGQEHQLSYSKINWSQISSDADIDAYKNLQQELCINGKSSLHFDFVEWN